MHHFACTFQIINRGAVLLNTTQAANISIRLTVPFGCQRNETKCYLDINVFMSRTNQCDIADVGLKQTSPNRCGIRFFNNETGVTKKLTLQAITVPRTTPLSRVISANFATQSVYKAHPIFGGYTIDTLDVSTHFDCQYFQIFSKV